MLGLSAQDTNIQNNFVVAQQNLPASFPTHPPAVILSEDTVGPDQLSLLQNFYKTDYAAKAQAIEESALLRSYGQSLLPALWLHVVSAKLDAFVASGATGLSPPEVDQLRLALRVFRDRAAAAAVPKQHEEFMLAALLAAGRAISLFRDGRKLPADSGLYTPLSIASVAKSLADPNLPSSGAPELALVLALVALGQKEGLWTCTLSENANPKSGAMRVNGTFRSAEVFFAANSRSAGRLIALGYASEDDDAIIVHSHEIPRQAPRHPTAPPGRTLRRGRREISVAAMATTPTSLDALFKRFRGEIAL